MARQINDIVLTGNGLLVTFDDNFSQQLVWEYVDGVLSLTDGKRIIAESVLDEIKNKSTINLSSATVWSHLFGSYGKPLDVTSITTGSITASGSVTAASVAASGGVTAASLGVTGSIIAASVAVTGGVTAASVEAASLVSDELVFDTANQDVKISSPSSGILRIGDSADTRYLDYSSITNNHYLTSHGTSATLTLRNSDLDSIVLSVATDGSTLIYSPNNYITFGSVTNGMRYISNFGPFFPIACHFGSGYTNSIIGWNTQSTGSAHLLFGTQTHYVFSNATNSFAGRDFQHVDTTGAVYIHSVLQDTVATDQYLRLLHDTTDAVIESGAGDITLNPASNIVKITNGVDYWNIDSTFDQYLGFVGPVSGKTIFQIHDAVSSGTSFSFLDDDGDGLLVVTTPASSRVTIRTENLANTQLWIGQENTGIAYDLFGTTEEDGVFIYKPHFSRFTEANTAVAASPNVLTARETGNVITNEGATAENHHTLPTAAAGYQFTFIVQDVDGIQVNAAAGDTIRIGGTVSASGGFVSSATIGDVLTLVAINATEWVATTPVGSWTFDV